MALNKPTGATLNDLLVGMTTYTGNLETRLIQNKVLRHFRKQNDHNLPLLLICDGPILDNSVYKHVDYVISRPGPSGLQLGELTNLQLLADFAHAQGYKYVIKMPADVIMTQPRWAAIVFDFFLQSKKKILSTHWFSSSSWVVGTKFFVAEVEFLRTTLPHTMTTDFLEDVFTDSIKRHFDIKDVAHLINSTTGEINEVSAELKEWGWEHAHRLYKFKHLDDEDPLVRRITNRHFLYNLFRIQKQITRTARVVHNLTGRQN